MARHKDEVCVSEIPAAYSILGYKAFLDQLAREGKIRAVENSSHSNKISFTFTPAEGFEPTLKNLALQEHVSCQYKFLRDGAVVEFASSEAYLEAWFEARLAWVARRRAAALAEMQREIDDQARDAAMLRFVLERGVTARTPRDVYLANLRAGGFDDDHARAFLQRLKLWNVSPEGLAEAEAELGKLEAARAAYAGETVEGTVRKELDAAEGALRKQLEETEERNFAVKKRPRN